MKKQNKQTKSKLKVIESKVLGGFPVLNMCVRKWLGGRGGGKLKWGEEGEEIYFTVSKMLTNKISSKKKLRKNKDCKVKIKIKNFNCRLTIK